MIESRREGQFCLRPPFLTYLSLLASSSPRTTPASDFRQRQSPSPASSSPGSDPQQPTQYVADISSPPPWIPACPLHSAEQGRILGFILDTTLALVPSSQFITSLTCVPAPPPPKFKPSVLTLGSLTSHQPLCTFTI